MSKPSTVIVVLNWNGRQDTLDCLESLRGLQPGRHEILVVDNGSEDGSEAAIRSAYPELPLLQTGSNLGFAGGNNAGITWALERGADYVLLLNNDTVVEPDFLHRMLERAASDPRLGIVGASIAYADDPRNLWAYGGGRFDLATGWVRHVQRELPDDQLRTRGHRHFYVTGCAMLLKREMLEEIGSLDTSYFHFCEDVDLCVRAEAAGWRIAVAAAARMVHKVSATTRVSSPLFLYYNLRSRLSLVRRHGPPGAPGRAALILLWLRLWRPALFSGLGVAGWKALRRAHRDFLDGAEGPAPSELQRIGRSKYQAAGIFLLAFLACSGGLPRSSPAQDRVESVRSERAFLDRLEGGGTGTAARRIEDLLYAMAADSSVSRRAVERAGEWARPMTHRLVQTLALSELEARDRLDRLYSVHDRGPRPGARPPAWSEVRMQGLELLQRIAPREGVGRDLRLLREIEQDQISSMPGTRPRPSWVAARLQLWLDWWYEVGMEESFWLDPSRRPDLEPWRAALSRRLEEGGTRLFELLIPMADDPLASNALIAGMDGRHYAHLVAECLEIILLYQANLDELGVPRRRWDPDQGRLVGHTAAELRALPLSILQRVCSFLPSGANEAEVIESYALWWQRARFQARYYRDPRTAPQLAAWLGGWEIPEEQGGIPMAQLLRRFYVAEGFRDLLLDQMGPQDEQLVSELVSWLARDRADAVANGFSVAYRRPPLRPLPGEEGRLVAIPWEAVQAMIREMLRRITGDVGLPEEGVDEFTRNQFWFDWWRAHDREPRWYRGTTPEDAAPSFEMERAG